MEMKKEVNEKVELIEKVEQPNFSVENIRETRPAYHRSGDLVWKNKPKRPKQYVQYPIEKIIAMNSLLEKIFLNKVDRCIKKPANSFLFA